MTGESITVQTPAKINLGLEIPGRRPDGYHEIRTVLVMLDLVDTLTVDLGGKAFDQQGIPSEVNIVTRALGALADKVDPNISFGWSIEKCVPIAAGLGGASGNAAGALLAGNHLLGNPLTTAELATIAGSLGSDIPFFLGPPTALATGRGADLEPCPSVVRDVVLIVPDIQLANKSALMYSRLEAADFSDGSGVQRIFDALKAGNFDSRLPLPNAFLKPLLRLEPSLPSVVDLLSSLDLSWSLSGAGPSFYVISEPGSGREVCDVLQRRLTFRAQVLSTHLRTVGITVDKTG